MMSLEGIRVLDLARGGPGPFCSMLMGDLGAEVTMVEVPPGASRGLTKNIDESERVHWPLNRNKRSIAMNMKHEAARDAFLKLAQNTDVIIDGFRPGVVDRLGIGYEQVRKLNERIIYCAFTSYGQYGPYSDLPGHDINFIALGGALGLIRREGEPPVLPPNIIGDFAGGGLFGAFAILAAIIGREKTGKGQYIDMSVTDGVTSLLTMPAAPMFAPGIVRAGGGILQGKTPHYNIYECADGKFIALGTGEPQFWKQLCELLGFEQYTNEGFNEEKWEEMISAFRTKLKEKTRDQWFEEMRQREIGVAPVLELDEVFEDQHMRARDMLLEFNHSEFGLVRQVGIAPKFSDMPGSVRSLGPKFAEHTDEMLRAVGYTAEQIAGMRAAGAIA